MKLIKLTIMENGSMINNMDSEWNHGLTVTFRDPAGHDRVLLFKDRESVRQLASQSDSASYKRIYQEAVQEKDEKSQD